MARVRQSLCQQPVLVESFAAIVNTMVRGEAALGVTI
jgi:hypothetical protein